MTKQRTIHTCFFFLVIMPILIKALQLLLLLLIPLLLLLLLGLSSQPELVAMLDSPQLKDPAVLKETIQQGLQTIRGYSSEILEFFSSPDKISTMLDQLPDEVRVPIKVKITVRGCWKLLGI